MDHFCYLSIVLYQLHHLILLYVYIPKLLNQLSKKEGYPVIEDAVFLDNETNYSLHNEVKLDLSKKLTNFNINPTTDSDGNAVGGNGNRFNYSLSMWLYINNYDHIETENISETNILNFNNGLPKLTIANSREKSSQIYVYYSNNQKDTVNIDIPYQKWNNVVFNYFSTHVDMFINGNLEKTFDFNDSNYPDYSKNISNEIIVGGENEITGAICNVRYYKENLSERKIVNFYNLLKNKNPPTYNL